MKKYLYLLISLLIATCITSCNKKSLNYRFVGCYIEFVETENKSLDDCNVKLYIDLNNKNALVDKNNIWQYNVESTQMTNDVIKEGSAIDVLVSGFYTIKGDVDKVKVYPIILRNNTFEILTKESKTTHLSLNDTKTITFEKTYVFEKQKYNFRSTVKFLKKEA